MPGTVTPGVVKAAGADLYYERRGAGPPLLMITGAPGDGGFYAETADILASDYTVITYDRRGNSRSTLHGDPVVMTVPQQSDDAIAVLAANGFGSARICGSSGGATIAFDLAARHPQVTESVVAHEPPLPSLLADPSGYLTQIGDVERTLAEQGWRPAFDRFQITIGAMPDIPQILGLLLNPASFLPPGPRRDTIARNVGNWAYMMTYEMRPFVEYQPDMDAIVSNRVKIILACGASTKDQREAEMSARAAELLGVECVKLTGGHSAALEMPQMFAPEVAALLARLDG